MHTLQSSRGKPLVHRRQEHGVRAVEIKRIRSDRKDRCAAEAGIEGIQNIRGESRPNSIKMAQNAQRESHENVVEKGLKATLFPGETHCLSHISGNQLQKQMPNVSFEGFR